jgi:hypothetical protein
VPDRQAGAAYARLAAFASATRIITRFPSALAARVIVSRLTETLRGSSRRSRCDRLVRRAKQQFGKINPNAPEELVRFAFLVGSWRFEAKVKLHDGQSHPFQGAWLGRYILDGYAIADEYRMTDVSAKLIVLGLNLRAYDASNQTWNIKWLNALTGAWMDLAPSELRGVAYDGQSISYAFKELVPVDAMHAYTCHLYTSGTHFTWRGEKSTDGSLWSEFMVVDCHRVGR